MDNKPSNATQQSAENPKGQCASMSGTTGTHSTSGTLNVTPTISIDPCGSLGHKSFEKK